MKNVLITGAGRGIGLALAKEFSQKGYHVLGTYRDLKHAEELLRLAKDGNITAVTADITDASSFGPLKKELEKLGNIDILINNAGVIGNKFGALSDVDAEDALNVFKVNTLGPLKIGQLAMPFLEKGGTVAHITSLMGSIADNGSGGYYAYRMSKTALNMFNRCLAHDFPDHTCLVLHPGWVQTDMGGANATVTKAESARGLCQVITQAKLSQSGMFFDYTGRELPW
jgi:NAD(P)-dependent dehydrogenase (short-subunit alcohol dehydrogenase family)